MESLPVISVIIPTHDRPETVCVAVMSALRQSYRELEVVVVIDGKYGETVSRLQQVADARLNWLELDVPRGAAAARNAGVEMARGEWIAFLDDDDEWLPEKLRLQMKAVKSAHVAMPVVCGAYWARQEGENTLFGRREPAVDEPLSEYMFCRRSLTYGENALATSVLLMPKSLMVRVPFDPNLKRHQDWDWALRALTHRDTTLIYVGEPTSIYNMPTGVERMSTGADWKMSLAWARERRNLFTERAFASFVVTECLTRAVRAKAGWRELLRLIQALFEEGEPDALTLAMMLRILLVPTTLSSKVRDYLRFGIS